MITIVFVLVLLVGFIVADAVLDYVFVIVYAFGITSILNNIFHLFKYYKKYNKVCDGDIGGIILYIIMIAVAALVHYFWL